jgi:hypothetical protein
VIDATAAAIRPSKSKSIATGFGPPHFGGGDDEFFMATGFLLLRLQELFYYFVLATLAAAVFGLDAGFFFVAGADTPIDT